MKIIRLLCLQSDSRCIHKISNREREREIDVGINYRHATLAGGERRGRKTVCEISVCSLPFSVASALLNSQRLGY